jgi:hypothetical protein
VPTDILVALSCSVCFQLALRGHDSQRVDDRGFPFAISSKGTLLRVADFVDNVIIPVANQHTQQLGDMARHKPHLHFDNSKYHTARYVQEETASQQRILVPHFPYSPELAIVDL